MSDNALYYFATKTVRVSSILYRPEEEARYFLAIRFNVLQWLKEIRGEEKNKSLRV